MKKTVHFLAIMSVIISFLFTSCVATKKFKASEAKVNNLQIDSTKTHGLLTDCNAQVKESATRL